LANYPFVESGGNAGIYGPESFSYDATTGNLASKAGVGHHRCPLQLLQGVDFRQDGDPYSGVLTTDFWNRLNGLQDDRRDLAGKVGVGQR